MATEMSALRTALCLCSAVAPLIAAAPAQTTTRTAESVTIAGTRPSVQVLPDRTVYALDKNIQSSAGSLSDVLRNLPSVDVDIQGNVSLRGDSNVTILVDGKKSAMLAGERGDAIQQIPANLVERIEIITNPSAEFRAEGSGGIINIVMKKNSEQFASGVVRLNAGNEGRINGSVSGNIKLGGVHLNGSLGERRDAYRYESVTTRSDGTATRSLQTSTAKSAYTNRFARLNAQYDATEKDHFEFGNDYNRYNSRYASQEHNITVGASDLTRNGLLHATQEDAQLDLKYRHAFADTGEEFTLDASHAGAWAHNRFDYTSFDTATGIDNLWQMRGRKRHDLTTELHADYVLPLDTTAKLKTGYALEIERVLTDKTGLWRDRTMTDWAIESAFTNIFSTRRTVQAAYASYEQKFGPFGAMAGLRMEHDDLHTDLKTTGEVHNTNTLGFYPSLQLTYNFADTQQIKLGYSRRMNRPDIGSLNPTPFSTDAYNVEAGNPLLKPEQIDSFETSYRYTGEQFEGVLTGYYRATYHGITNVYRYISDTVLLMTRDNLARRTAAGIEGNFNADVFSSLSWHTSGRVSYDELNPGTTSIGLKKSGVSWNIRSGFDWKITADDLIQFNTRYSGKQLLPQGYVKPSVSGDLGYKHSFDDGLAAVLSVNNLFDSRNRNSVLNAPGLYQSDRRAMNGRIYFIGLIYTFGGAKDAEQSNGNNDSGYQRGF